MLRDVPFSRICVPSELVEGMFIDTQHCLERCPGHWAAYWYAGDLLKDKVSKDIPAKLQEGVHA